MLNLKVLSVASAAFTIFSGANAGVLRRNQEPPQPACVDFTPFTYSGCFRDPPSPAPHALLYTSGLDSQNMTIEKCVAFCKGNDYRYAGLEYYGECSCGASIYGDQIDESYCSYPCTANQTESCGGSDAVSVYQDPTFNQVGDYTDISDYKPIGCHTEGTNGRSLAWRQDDVAEATLTIELCLMACKKGGYSIAGVEYGQECYCGVVLGNGTVSAPSTDCDIPCNGAPSTEICGGRSRLNIFVADDLESSEPCKDGPVTSSTTSVPPSTSTTSTSSTSSTDSSTTTTSSSSTTSSTSSSTFTTSKPPPTTSPPTTSTTKTTASLCTSTYTSTPTPTCEYKCGSWCSTPMPTWSDQHSCFKAQQNCAVQIAACFLNAGWPGNLQCFDFAKWCGSVSSYCSQYCPGGGCSKSKCKSKYPPHGPSPPSASVSTSVYTCPVSSTKTTSASTSTSSTCVPIPTNTNICVQPHNPKAGYSSTSPVGDIPLPCLTCNNLWSDYRKGNPFKLYAFPDSSSCSSYSRGGPSGPYKACRDACDNQYQSCISTYAQGCKNRSDPKFTDSYSVARKKCSDQREDCYKANANVNPSPWRCNSWDSGWW